MNREGETPTLRILNGREKTKNHSTFKVIGSHGSRVRINRDDSPSFFSGVCDKMGGRFKVRYLAILNCDDQNDFTSVRGLRKKGHHKPDSTATQLTVSMMRRKTAILRVVLKSVQAFPVSVYF